MFNDYPKSTCLRYCMNSAALNSVTTYFSSLRLLPPLSTLFPYTTLFRSAIDDDLRLPANSRHDLPHDRPREIRSEEHRLNSSHRCISYAVFCLKKKKK